MSLTELTGDFAGTNYSKPSDNGVWLVGRLASGDVVTGESAERLVPGAAYRFVGKWESSRYGKQFKFEHVAEAEPISRQAIVSFLTRYCGKVGMTLNRAHRCFEEHGSDCIRMLREHPEGVRAISSVDEENRVKITSILATEKRFMQVKIELALLLEGKGFSKNTIDECVKKWGIRASGIVKGDPFKMMTGKIKGAGFKRCDNLYLSLGHPADGMKRQVLCAWDFINRSNGDTWVQQAEVSQAVRSAVASADVNPKQAIKIGVRARMLAAKDVDGIRWLSTGRRADAERSLAETAKTLWSRPGNWPTKMNPGGMSDHQKAAMEKCLDSGFGLLIGGPGVGKTFCVAHLIKACQSSGAGAIAIAAPTGKAAVRASEMMQQNGVKAFASSIHSLLRGKMTDDGWTFFYDRSNPLPYRIVIIDEFSMVDVELAAALFEAIDPQRTSILCVGDQHQLSPVGHGAPLRDLLSFNRCVGELEEIRRNSGLIVHACRAIRDGNPIPSAEKLDDVNNLMFVHSWNSSGTIKAIKDLFQSLKAAGKRDIFDDVQVLVPLNTQGPLARETIAKILQNELNPIRKEDEDAVGVFRKGDKIICLSNDEYPNKSKETDYVANGEMGRVASAEKGEIIAEFPLFSAPTREIVFREKGPLGKSFALGYAITAHKSQGSQWPVIVVIADPAAGRVASRAWHYTSVSRASERCLIIGDKNVVEAQARKVDVERRKTFLVELINESKGTK